MSSCNTEEGKEFVGFFVGFVIFLVGTVVVGIPGIVFSAISISSKHRAVPILAIVFTSLYLIFFMVMMDVFGQGDAKVDGSVMVFPVINIAIILMNALFIYMGIKNRKNQPVSSADDKTSLLDDIINEEEEYII